MKTKIYSLLILLLFTSLGFSQGFRDKKEKIKALKIAFISQKLSLTTEQAEKFWPIYNKYEDKIVALKEMYGIQKHSLELLLNHQWDQQNIGEKC